MTDPTPAPTDPAPAPEPPEPNGDKKFSQADVDRIIAGRLAKYSDYDELKAKAEAAVAANQTDLERAVSKARQEASAEVTAAANKRLVAAEVRATAAELGFRDPADALAQYGDLTAVKVGDNGEVDEAAVKTRLEEISKAKPYLLKDSDAVAAPAAAGIGVGGNVPADVKPGLPRLQAAYAATPKK